MVKRFQRSSQVRFYSYWPLTWLIDILFEKLTPQIWDWIWKAPFAHFASGVGDFMQILASFLLKKIIVVTYSLMSWLKGSFRFTHLQARLMEKWVKTLNSELEGSWFKPRLPVTLGSNKYQAHWLRWG